MVPKKVLNARQSASPFRDGSRLLFLKTVHDFYQGKTAFVTGGGCGLGQALSRQLCARGATVVVADINRTAAGRVAAELTRSGGRAIAVELDVTQADAVNYQVDQIVSDYGSLDYMFNNAGILILSELRDMRPDQWQTIISVNLNGVIHGTQAAYAHMVKQGHGHIVNIASLGGLVPMPTCSAYSATKHAVVGLSHSLRFEAAKLGVKVTVVCPGQIDTQLGQAAIILGADRALLETQGRGWFRPMQPEQAARATLRGVERNQGTVVFPLTARLLWRAHRLHQSVLAPLGNHFVKALRAARVESNIF